VDEFDKELVSGLAHGVALAVLLALLGLALLNAL
jgi:hypothetical protein